MWVCVFAQESQCQTLSSPGVAGHEHGSLSGLVRVRESRRTEPVLQTGVGKPTPVGRVAETLAPAPSPPSPRSLGWRSSQGHHDGQLVPANGEHARRSRAGRQRRVPSAFAGQEETPSSPSPPPEQTD